MQNLKLLTMTLLITSMLQIANAGSFMPTPITPPLLTLKTPIEKACESYYPPDFETDEPPGATVLTIYVLVTGATGKINVTASSGSPTLDAAAINCIENLGVIYQPATVGDRLIAQWQTLTLNWTSISKTRPQKSEDKPFFSTP